MPVDLSIPNSIIAAFQAGQQLKEHRRARAVQEQQKQQQIDIQAKAEQERERQNQALQKQFQDTLQQHKEQFQAEHKLREATHNLALARAGVEIAQALGGAVTGQEAPEDVAEIDLPSLGGKIKYLSPTGQAKKIETLGAAQAKVKGKIAGAVAEAEQPFKLEEEQVKAGLHEQALIKMREMQFADQKSLAKLQNDLRFDSAARLLGMKQRYKMQEGGGLDPDSINLALQDIRSGNRTLEDLTKSFPLAQRSILTKNATARNITIPRDEDRKTFQSMTLVKGMVDQIDAMNAALKAGNFNEYDELSNQFDTVAGNFARTVSSERGNMSNADIQRIINSKPSKLNVIKGAFTQKNPNDLRVKNVRDFVLNKQKSVLNRFSVGQQHDIIQTYGLFSPYEEPK